MDKEHADKLLNIRVPQTLFEKFRDKCNENYKTMSEALRDFMQQYIKEDKIKTMLLKITDSSIVGDDLRVSQCVLNLVVLAAELEGENLLAPKGCGEA